MLKAVAKIAAMAGAIGSVGLVLVVGHRNSSVVLLLMFAFWVLAPFIALLLADLVWKRGNAALYSLMPVLAVGSLAIYGSVAFGPPRAKPAAVFLMVPVASWLLIAIVGMLSRRLTKSPNN